MSNLRILHYNIAHGRGDDRTPDTIHGLGALGLAYRSVQKNFHVLLRGKDELMERLEQIAFCIKEQDPDIVSLNEADFRSIWSFNVDMLSFFAEQLALPHKAYGQKWAMPGIHHGCGLISRFPLMSRYVPCSTNRFPVTLLGGVGYLDATIFIDGHALNLLCCHLSPGPENAVQIKEITTHLAAVLKPVILAGDLNMRLQDIDLGSRLQAWPELARAEQNYATFISRQGTPKCIDHIFTDKMLPLRDLKVLDVHYSDHKPVVAQVDWTHYIDSLR
ncbi:endonuclease/exonuclease/phosphatase family protein [Candidatus Woesearchaeota archaeon]|nr:endonuclease/exonuclease/phosphatase family protein [Candidatus Woesearchaeota archaeon]